MKASKKYNDLKKKSINDLFELTYMLHRVVSTIESDFIHVDTKVTNSILKTAKEELNRVCDYIDIVENDMFDNDDDN